MGKSWEDVGELWAKRGAMADVKALLAQADEACEIARQALASEDLVTGFAAIILAAQLVQLAHIFEVFHDT